MPSVLAVFRLTTNSYFVGPCTGRSAGFSPLRIRSTYRRRSGQGGDHGHLALNQFDHHGRQSIVLTIGPTIFDFDVPALGNAGLAQASKECSYKRRPLFSRCTAKDPNRRRPLLRARRQWPCGDAAAEQRDELSPRTLKGLRGFRPMSLGDRLMFELDHNRRVWALPLCVRGTLSKRTLRDGDPPGSFVPRTDSCTGTNSGLTRSPRRRGRATLLGR